MGFWRKLKKVAHKVSHPAKTFKKLEKVVQKAAKVVVKDAGKGLKLLDKGINEVEKNAKLIKTIVNVTASVVEVIGTATGQPEIVAGAASLQLVADKALDAAAKAKKLSDAGHKALAIAEAIAEKKKLSVIMHATADAMISAGEASGNAKLTEMAGHVKTSAGVVDDAVKHARDVHQIAKDTINAVKKGDVGGVVKNVSKGVKKVKQVKKDVKEVKGKFKKTTKGKKTKTDKEGETEGAVVHKEVKKSTRAPSKYNLFVKKQMAAGLSFTESAKSWKTSSENPKNQ